MSSKSWLGFVAGMAVGATTAVLLAPDKGKNTRKRIKNKVKDLGVDLDNVERKVDDGLSRVNQITKSAKESYTNLRNRSKETTS